MVGAVFLQRYVALSLLGKGSMGTVYLARDQREPRVVVVKLMHPEVTRDPHFQQFFEQEVESLTQLRHPCVVALLDAALRDLHGPCLVMEFIPGMTLEILLRRHKRLTVQQTGRLLLPICLALDAGHQHGIVHRDVKPANMMVVSPDSDDETVKVMDFGLAQINRQPHISLDKLRGSDEAMTCGTPMYLPPEAARGDTVDHRADLYSLGVLLFEMLIGKPPFNLETVEAIIKAHMQSPPPPFARALLGHGIPPKVESVVQHCLAKFPNERPQSARQVAERYFEAMGHKLPDAGIWRSNANDRKHSSKQGPIERFPLTTHPNALVEQFEAWMPEPIAVVKLRGFAEDMGGRILESKPGQIRVQLGEDRRPMKADMTDSALARWLKGKTTETRLPDSDQEPIDLLLYMERSSAGPANKLNITAVMKPLHGARLIAMNKWKPRCEKILNDLRAYLIGQKSPQ